LGSLEQPKPVGPLKVGDAKAMRDAYGETLVALGAKDKNVVVLDADLSGSTKTGLFAKKFPDRFFNFGIAEQNMLGAATGLALSGKTVFASTFAMFATTRALDQFRNALAFSKANVKVVVTHAGLMTGPDGASHQSLEDLAVARTLPNLTVIAPADAVETSQVIELAARERGPFYVRLVREKTPLLYDEKYRFKLGKASVLQDGRDLMVFAIGPMVAEALKARGLLKAQGFDIGVVNTASIKPFDAQTVVKYAKRDGFLFTVEDHSVLGGLGSVVCEVLAREQPAYVYRHGTHDLFGESGESKPLYKKYELDAEGIALHVKKALTYKQKVLRR